MPAGAELKLHREGLRKQLGFGFGCNLAGAGQPQFGRDQREILELGVEVGVPRNHHVELVVLDGRNHLGERRHRLGLARGVAILLTPGHRAGDVAEKQPRKAVLAVVSTLEETSADAAEDTALAREGEIAIGPTPEFTKVAGLAGDLACHASTCPRPWRLRRIERTENRRRIEVGHTEIGREHVGLGRGLSLKVTPPLSLNSLPSLKLGAHAVEFHGHRRRSGSPRQRPRLRISGHRQPSSARVRPVR